MTADTSTVTKVAHSSPQGATYYRQDYTVVLSVGKTEMEAYIVWKENVRVIKCCPSPVPDLPPANRESNDGMWSTSFNGYQCWANLYIIRGPAEIVYYDV